MNFMDFSTANVIRAVAVIEQLVRYFTSVQRYSVFELYRTRARRPKKSLRPLRKRKKKTPLKVDVIREGVLWTIVAAVP